MNEKLVALDSTAPSNPTDYHAHKLQYISIAVDKPFLLELDMSVRKLLTCNDRVQVHGNEVKLALDTY